MRLASLSPTISWIHFLSGTVLAFRPLKSQKNLNMSALAVSGKLVGQYNVEQRISADEESTICVTPLPLIETEKQRASTVLTIVTAVQAQDLIHQVQSALTAQQARIARLNQSLIQQQGMAKGRHAVDNGTGACLAME